VVSVKDPYGCILGFIDRVTGAYSKLISVSMFRRKINKGLIAAPSFPLSMSAEIQLYSHNVQLYPTRNQKTTIELS
jgi:hypothetical protein